MSFKIENLFFVYYIGWKITIMQQSIFVYFLLALFLLAGCTPSSADAQSEQDASQETTVSTPIYEVVDIPTFKSKIDGGNVKLIDVRRPEEFAAGHIEGATNINVLDSSFKDKIQEFAQTNETVLLYCKSGKRSARASKQMQDLGYNIIYDLKGGYLAWSKE